MITTSARVDRLVTEHLSAQGRPDPRGVSVVSGVQTKLEHFTLTFDRLTIIKNGLKMRKLQPPKGFFYVALKLLEF
jgi:hypothetical protein